MINVAVIDSKSKSRMLLKYSMKSLSNTVKAFSDIFCFSNYSERRKRDVFDVFVYNISDSFTYDMYRSILFLTGLFSKATIIVVSNNRNTRLIKALHDMGVSKHIIFESDKDLKLKLDIVFNEIKNNMSTIYNVKRKSIFNLSVAAYGLFVGVILSMLLGHTSISKGESNDFYNDQEIVTRGANPVECEVPDTLNINH